MALAETANLIVKLSLGGNFTSQIGKATASLGKLEKGSGRAYRAGQQIGTGIKSGVAIAAVGVGLLTTQVAVGLRSLIELEKATAQTEAVIKSTGGAAGVTAQQVRDLAEKYESLNATIGDEAIQAGQNLLLTYTNIRKEAFEPALEAALNLSVALGTDLDSAIKTVGKALSDPAKGIARLTRAGIILTKSEEKQIKAHIKNNDTLSAQRVILAALDERYGGSFLAGGATTAGKVAKFGDAIEDLQRSLATALLPTVSNVADALSRDPEVIRGAETLGKEIGTMFSPANIKAGIGAIREGAGFLITIAGQVSTIVGGAVSLFKSLPPELQKLAVGALVVNKLTGGLVTNLAGGLISAVLSSFKGLMTVNAGVVNVNGAVTGAGAAGAAGGTGLVGNLFKILGVGILAGAANEFAPAIEQAGRDLRKELVGENFPKLETTDLEWPFGPKNTPSILPDIFGGNGLLGGRPAAPNAPIVQQRAPSDPRPANFMPQLRDSFDRAVIPVAAAVKTVGTKVDAAKQVTQMTGLAAVLSSAAAGAVAAGAASMAGHQVAGAIASKNMSFAVDTRVTVNVSASQVTKSVVVQERAGPGNGSRGSSSLGGGFMGGAR